MIAIIGKTEGNGGVNDYTRIIADRAFREVLVAKGAPGRPGQAGPDRLVGRHRRRDQPARHDLRHHRLPSPSDEPRLTVGFAMSEQLLPEEIGRTAMITKVADAVKVAMERAGITDPADVHYVQTKTPLLTIHTIRDAKSRGKTVWTEHTHESMDLSNGVHRARHRRRPRRDRDADRRRRDAQPRAVLRRWPPAPRASSWTRPRWSWSATRRASAAATGSATR